MAKENSDYRAKQRKPALTTLVYGKVPPQAPDLEEAVLGACLLEKETFEMVMEVLPSGDCMYTDAHQKIFSAMRSLYDRGIDVDLLTVTEELRKTSNLELIGDAYYLTDLTTRVLSSAHAQTHARIVMEKFILRELIRISGGLIGDAYNDATDVFDLLDKAETELYQISQRMLKSDYSSSEKVIRQVLNEDSEMEAEEGFTGLTSGNKDLDGLTGGFKAGKVYVIAARPAVGKTGSSLNILHHLSVKMNIPTGFFSLEMSKSEIVRILLAMDAQIDTYHINDPKLRTEQERTRYNQSAQRLSKAKFYIDDGAGITIAEFRAKARRMVNKHKVKLIFIDYIQLMRSNEKLFNREGEIAEISREIKRTAKELKIPIVALCQLNRDIEKRADGKFKLSDIRESGAIEQDADFIGFLWRPDEEDIKKDPSLEGLGKLNIAKHRGGKKGTVLYSTDMSTQTWAEYDTWKIPKQPEPPQKPYAGMNTFNPSPETTDDLPF